MANEESDYMATATLAFMQLVSPSGQTNSYEPSQSGNALATQVTMLIHGSRPIPFDITLQSDDNPACALSSTPQHGGRRSSGLD